MNRNYDKIMDLLSHERLISYQNIKNTLEPQIILDTYLQSLLKNKELYAPLHILEIILRNKIHHSIAEILKSPIWLTNCSKQTQLEIKEKFCFVSEKTIHEFHKQVTLASQISEQTAKSQNRSVIEGDLIANLSFGFWTSLLSHAYANIFSNKKIFLLVFENHDFGKFWTDSYFKQEKYMRFKIDYIRKCRNRLFHHDRIQNHDNILKNIWKIIESISPDCCEYFQSKI